MIYDTIEELYTEMIRATGYDVDSKGIVTMTVKEKTSDITVDTNGTERILMLPTYDNLRDPRPETHVFFHPLAENIERGKSEVFDFYHRRLINKINSLVAIIGVGLLNLQNNPNLHIGLNKEQMDIMKVISESSEKSPLNWAQLSLYPVTKMPDRMDKWGVNIFIKKKGKFEGKEYKRVGVVGFPAFEFIEGGGQYFKDDSKDASRIGRIQDYKTFVQVMKAIFPEIKSIEAYNAGVDTSIAPNLIAFLRAVRQLGRRMNYVVDTMTDVFAKIGVDDKLARLSIDWIDNFDDDNHSKLSNFLRMIPSLEGNAGRPDFRALAEEREPKKEKARDEPSKTEALPWEDEPAPRKETRSVRDDRSESAPTNAYGLKVTWASKGGGTVKDLIGEREREQREERDRREREIEERRRREREEREEEDRRIRARREREREERDDEDRRRRERQRERDEEEYESRNRGRERDRDERPRERDREPEPERTESGKLNFAAVLRNNPSLARGTRTEEELRERDRDRGRGRGWGRDRYYDRDYERDDRGRGYGRDRDRDYRDRDYRDRDYDRDRGYGRDRDRDYDRGRSRARDRLGWGR